MSRKKSSLIANSIAMLLVVVTLSSCFGSRKLQEDLANSREPGKEKFVVTKDSTKYVSEKLSFRYPLFKAQKVVLDNGTEIKMKEVVAYQDDNAYYMRLQQSPYGFASRIKRGPINMYRAIMSESYYDPSAGATTFSTVRGPNGTMSYQPTGHTGGWRRQNVPVYFLQDTKTGKLLDFNVKNTEMLVQNYQPAYDYVELFRHNKAKYRTWSWINTAAVLGGIALMATVPESSTGKSNYSQGYAGLAIFGGGLVNGIINKVRKAKNYKNLELAVDEYNSGWERSQKKKNR